MIQIILVLMVLCLGGCSVFQQGGDAQQNPIVQGSINVGARNQCLQFARDQPENAKATGQYLSTLDGAITSCIDGIHEGLAPTPIP